MDDLETMQIFENIGHILCIVIQMWWTRSYSFSPGGDK